MVKADPVVKLPIYAGEKITLTANLKANTGVGAPEIPVLLSARKTKVYLTEATETRTR